MNYNVTTFNVLQYYFSLRFFGSVKNVTQLVPLLRIVTCKLLSYMS